MDVSHGRQGTRQAQAQVPVAVITAPGYGARCRGVCVDVGS